MKTGRWHWLGFRRETSRDGVKWEWGAAVWLHDKRATGGARRLIAAVHLGVYTAAIGCDLQRSG